MPDKVNLAEAFATFNDHWNPRVAGDINDFQVKLVKLDGKFDWHHHDVEDELFLVVAGRMKMAFRDRDVIVDGGKGFGEVHLVDHRHSPSHASMSCHSVIRLSGNQISSCACNASGVHQRCPSITRRSSSLCPPVSISARVIAISK